MAKTWLSKAGGVGSIPEWGAKIPYVSLSENQNINNRSSGVTNSIKTLKMVCIKKRTLKKKILSHLCF